jgi:hypothetical protein
VAGIVVQLSFLARPVCLPVLARLWRPRHTGKIAHARELAELIAARYPDRTVHVVGDAAYVGERLRDLDGRISWTSRLKVTSMLHELPHRAPGARAGRAPAAPGWAPPPMSPPAPQPPTPGQAARDGIQDQGLVSLDGLGELDERLETTPAGPGDPVCRCRARTVSRP